MLLMPLNSKQRLIAATTWHSTPIGRFLCSAAGGSRGGDTVIEQLDKNRTRRLHGDGLAGRRSSVRLGGGGGGVRYNHPTRTPRPAISSKVVEESNGSFSHKDDNLRRLQDTFDRSSSHRRRHANDGRRSFPNTRNLNDTQRPTHPSRSTATPRYNNYKSYDKSEYNAENKRIYQKIIKCNTITDIVDVAHENLDKLSPRTTAAVWKHISLLLNSKRQSYRDDFHSSQLHQKLEELLCHTSSKISASNPSVLASTSHALASMVKATLSSNESNGRDSNRLLQNLLIKYNVEIWDKIQHRYLEMENSFGARQIATIAWSFATAMQLIARDYDNNESKTQFNVSPFFSAAHRTFQSRRDKFSYKHMCNLAWACMMCKHSMPELYHDLAEEFISRQMRQDNNEDLDAVVLCQLVSAFANARHNDLQLFESVARAALPLLPGFDGRHLANLVRPYAYAKIVPKFDNGRTLFDEVAEVTIPQVKSLTPQNMANIVWAYATTEQSHPALFSAISKEALHRLKEFSAKQLSNLAWALSKDPPEDKELIFDMIASEVVRRGLETFTSQGMTMMAHSFATVSHKSDDKFWDIVENSALERAAEFGHLECVQMAWAFATIERSSDLLFHVLERVAVSNIRSANSQGLSNLAWAFSTLGYTSLPLFRAIADNSMRKINEFKPKEMAMLVLSFSRIGHQFPSLFDKIATRSISDVQSFGSLDLFNMVVSYVKAGESQRNQKLMKAIAEEIVRRPSRICPKMLVGIAWSYASEEFRDPPLFNFISKECVGHCAPFDSKEIASLAWSFAAVGRRDRLLLQKLAEVSANRWQEFGAQPLANMAWAYATAEEDQPSLFRGIAESAITAKDDFTSQGISNLLWAFSAAGYPDQHLFQSLTTATSSVLQESGHQSLANIAWAYAVANVDDNMLFNEEFVSACVDKQHEFDYQGLRQLHQWNLWRKELESDIVLPQDFGRRCYNEFINQSLIISNLQKEVTSVLHSVGLAPDEEVQTKSGYVLDATLICNGKVVGVEVDGPYHFIGRRLKGNTILKQRQVAHVDSIPIISVPYWDWIDKHTLEEKEGYVLNKIDEVKSKIV